MVQLTLLTGKQAGSTFRSGRFPLRIGRSPRNDLQLEDPGVWDEHLRIEVRPAEGYILHVQHDALATINGASVQKVRLSNGDVIEIGQLKIEFALGQMQQAGLRVREGLTWAAIAAICLGQVALIYWLLK